MEDERKFRVVASAKSRARDAQDIHADRPTKRIRKPRVRRLDSQTMRRQRAEAEALQEDRATPHVAGAEAS